MTPTSGGITCYGGHMGCKRESTVTDRTMSVGPRSHFLQNQQNTKGTRNGGRAPTTEGMCRTQETPCATAVGRQDFSPGLQGRAYTGSISTSWSLDTKGIFTLQLAQSSSFLKRASEDTAAWSSSCHPSFLHFLPTSR